MCHPPWQSLAGAEGKLLFHPFPKLSSRIQPPTKSQKQDYLLCWFFKQKRVTLFLCSVLSAGTSPPWLHHSPWQGTLEGWGLSPAARHQDACVLWEDAVSSPDGCVSSSPAQNCGSSPALAAEQGLQGPSPAPGHPGLPLPPPAVMHLTAGERQRKAW